MKLSVLLLSLWDILCVYSPRQPESGSEESEGEEESGDGGDSEEGDDREEGEEEEVRFGEQTLESLPQPDPEVRPGSFKGFGFKKRSIGRPQIRSRTSELS